MVETETLEIEIPRQYKELLDDLEEELDADVEEDISRGVMQMISDAAESNMELN